MKRYISIILSLLLFLIILNGCSGGSKDKDNSNKIRFKDTMSISKLKQFNDQTVEIIGFLSPASPLDGEYAYLMNMPYQSCVFCVPNTNDLVNTLAIYPKKGEKIKYTDLPVKIVGTLIFDNTTDNNGYSYEYRLIDIVQEKADISGMEKTIRIYTDLIDKGFSTEVENVMTSIYKVIRNKEFFSDGKIPVIDSSKIKAKFDGLDEKDYSDILDVVNRLEALVNSINTDVSNKKLDGLMDYDAKAQQLYSEYYNWLVKPTL